MRNSLSGRSASGRRRSLSLLAAAVAVATLAGAASSSAAGAASPEAASARHATGALPQIKATPRAGAAAVALSPEQRRKLLDKAAESAADTARELGLGAQEALVPRDVVKDADGTVHLRYERTYAGLPVLGGDLVVHRRDAKPSVTYASKAKLSLPTTKAEVPAATARKSSLSTAATEGTDEAAVDAAPRLVVWNKGEKPTLAWESVVTGVQEDGSPSELHVVTDAATGDVLETAEQVESATGNSQHSGQVTIGSTRQDDGTFVLTDPQTGHRTLDASVDSRGVPFTDDDDVYGDGTAADPQTAAVDAAYGAQTTWNFYHDRFGRNGIANDGRSSYSRVHYEQSRGVPLANANWQDGCFCMSYGDGADGQHPVTSLDIAAHEMTHGVTSTTARLGDYGESPALNEAISDMMAAAVEFFADSKTDVPDYLVAEESDLHGDGKPIRYMDRPSKLGPHPTNGEVPLDYWSPSAKSAEAHMAAGIGDHFFYLMAEGSGRKTINGVDYDSPTYDGQPVAGIGLHNATNVVYRALTVYMTSTTDYPGARTATLQAAADLFGTQSDAYESVANAWAGVNVGPRFVQHIAVESLPTEPVALGQPVSRQITAISTRPGALSYSAEKLPKGLSIDRSGLITGTPSKAGTYDTVIDITTSAAETRSIPVTWTVLESGGHFFVNPTTYVIPQWGQVESPLIVKGKPGKAPRELKVTVDLDHGFTGAQVIDLIAPDGTVIPVKPWVWEQLPELHETYTVDASAVPAVGTWKLRVIDGTPGFYDLDPGHLQRWSLTF
ncbi:M4 family metallopeptidase [Actinacidiphila sp. bgisy167]|uniref:M4 family metallopeptidase n=1 Tax=Actinacidiphila sp. bgisy167 TaxID=3413797 RepID=UPI003D70B9D9